MPRYVAAATTITFYFDEEALHEEQDEMRPLW